MNQATPSVLPHATASPSLPHSVEASTASPHPELDQISTNPRRLFILESEVMRYMRPHIAWSYHRRGQQPHVSTRASECSPHAAPIVEALAKLEILALFPTFSQPHANITPTAHHGEALAQHRPPSPHTAHSPPPQPRHATLSFQPAQTLSSNGLAGFFPPQTRLVFFFPLAVPCKSKWVGLVCLQAGPRANRAVA